MLENHKKLAVIVLAIVLVVVVIVLLLLRVSEKTNILPIYGDSNVLYENIMTGQEGTTDLSDDEVLKRYAYIARDFEKTLKEEPERLDIALKLATVYYNMGDLDGAADSTKKAIAINPEDTDLYLTLARILRDGDAYEEARTYYREVLNKDKTAVDIYIELATMVKNNLEDVPAAIAIIKEGISNNYYDQSLIKKLNEFNALQ